MEQVLHLCSNQVDQFLFAVLATLEVWPTIATGASIGPLVPMEICPQT